MLFITIVISCKKIDKSVDAREKVDYSKRFLNLPANSPSVLKRIAEAIRKQNDESKFLNWFAQKYGYPVWSKSPIFTPKPNSGGRSAHVDDTLAFIPLVQDGINQVYSFLACKIEEDSVKIKLLRGDAYAGYGKKFKLDTLCAEFVAMHCMILENKLFGHESFRVNDLELFRKNPAGTSNESRFIYLKEVYDSSKSSRVASTARSTDVYIPIWTTYCVDWTVEGDQGQVVGVPPGGTPDYSYGGSNCFDIVTFLQIIDNGPTGTIPTQGSGGGGGTPWYEENPCTAHPVPGFDDCGDELLTGWVAIDDVNPSDPYNILWFDTVGYSSGLQSVYPCMYHLIHDSLPNLNYLAQLAGTTVFEDSAYMHLTFDTSTTLTVPDSVVARTTTFGVSTDVSGFTHFTATIQFNGWYLRNSTKEYKVSTIVHEVMHAIFKLRWGQYQQWLQNHSLGVDSFYMKSHFPIYWSTYVVSGVPPAYVSDHQIMATDYNNFFTSLVSPFYNPNAPSSVRDTVLKAMGYGGMRETTAWKLLPSQGIDTCKYRRLNRTAEKALIGSFTMSGCPVFTTHYADSLYLSTGCY